MLSGEYAVLHGGPAILACVNRFVTVSVAPRDADASQLTLRGFADLDVEFTMADGQPVFGDLAEPGDVALVRQLLIAYPPTQPVEMCVDSRPMFDAGRKLGLGSSAAVAVAAGNALAAFSGQAASLDGLLTAHLRFQGGHGSGADVVAVARGGLLAFHPSVHPAPGIEALDWPTNLLAQPVACPGSAATVSRVHRFNYWFAQDSSSKTMVGNLKALAGQIANVWHQGDAAAIIDRMQAFAEHMLVLDRAAALDYMAGGHQQLSEIAVDAGVLYKPCGAGGGDFGVAFALDAEPLQQFVQLATDAGFKVPDMRMTDSRPTLDVRVQGAQQ